MRERRKSKKVEAIQFCHIITNLAILIDFLVEIYQSVLVVLVPNTNLNYIITYGLPYPTGGIRSTADAPDHTGDFLYHLIVQLNFLIGLLLKMAIYPGLIAVKIPMVNMNLFCNPLGVYMHKDRYAKWIFQVLF